MIKLGTMAYLLPYRAVLRWPWSHIQTIIDERIHRAGLLVLLECQKSWTSECHALDLTLKQLQGHPRRCTLNTAVLTSCWNCSSCGTGWKHLIWWAFELLKVAYLESSDWWNGVSGKQNIMLPSYYLIKSETAGSRNLFPYLKKWHTLLHQLLCMSQVSCKSVI